VDVSELLSLTKFFLAVFVACAVYLVACAFAPAGQDFRSNLSPPYYLALGCSRCFGLVVVHAGYTMPAFCVSKTMLNSPRKKNVGCRAKLVQHTAHLEKILALNQFPQPGKGHIFTMVDVQRHPPLGAIVCSKRASFPSVCWLVISATNCESGKFHGLGLVASQDCEFAERSGPDAADKNLSGVIPRPQRFRQNFFANRPALQGWCIQQRPRFI
jgi:hypothetical protein